MTPDDILTIIEALTLAVAVVCIIIAIAAAGIAARNQWRRQVWSTAFYIASEHPTLLAEVAAEEGWEGPAEKTVVALDAMSHDDLLDQAITAREEVTALAEEIEDTKSGHDAEMVAARLELRREVKRADREERAKRRHWKTITRLKREAAS